MTAPAIAYEADSEPNEHGWYAEPLTIHWTCSDSLSGLTGPCPASTTLNEEGMGQHATMNASDRADNVAAASAGPINIDLGVPLVAVDPTPMSSGEITGTASDSLSGVQGVIVELTGLLGTSTVPATLNGEIWSASTDGLVPGIYSITAVGTDLAGNERRSTPQSMLVLG